MELTAVDIRRGLELTTVDIKERGGADYSRHQERVGADTVDIKERVGADYSTVCRSIP